jgi:Ran GTPase-activating protein (RanGAP) involved in mRNA processing and transport
MSAVRAYKAACDQAGVKVREYLTQTLEQIEAEMEGERRAGVINLRGTAKPLFKDRLVDADVSCFFDALAVFQSDFSAIEVDLSCNRVTGAGAQRVCEFLGQPGVRIGGLNLSDNDIDTEGVMHSIVALLRTTGNGLEALDLSGNEIGAKGAMAVITSLEEHRSLRRLNLGRTGFDSSAVIALCDMLRHKRNTTLTHLGLSTPFVSKRSVPCLTLLEHIGLMLKHNPSVVSLDLTGHKIDDRGAEVLCAYLCSHGSVRELLLSRNHINFKGAAAVSALLVHEKCALQRLDLSRNDIQDDGAVSLAQGLVRNATLRDLDLSDNNIADEGLLQLQVRLASGVWRGCVCVCVR